MAKKRAKKDGKNSSQTIRARDKKHPGAQLPRWVKKEHAAIMNVLSGRGHQRPGDVPRPKSSPKKLVKKKSKTSTEDDDHPPWEVDLDATKLWDPRGEDDE